MTNESDNSALVLLSGGQDSTTCLYIAKRDHKEVIALNFNYEQKHQAELDAAWFIAEMAKVELIMLEFNLLNEITTSSLLIAEPTHPHKDDLPKSFVPGRNILFLTIAGIIAFQRDIKHIYIGVSQEDYSGYPDCRADFINAMASALREGIAYPFDIVTPLLYKTKKEIVQTAVAMPDCMEALKYSHTCYEGKFPPCNECEACKLRAKGFNEACVVDPLLLHVKDMSVGDSYK